jgi:hypothetical protein
MELTSSSDYSNICSRATFHDRQNAPFTRPWFAQSYSTAVSWPKGRRTNYSYFRGRFSERLAARKSKMVSTGWGTTTNSIKSLNALNFTKTSRLRYADHMIRRPKDLPQRALFRGKPNGRRNQGRPKSRKADGVISDNLDQRLEPLCSRQADMKKSFSIGLNQVLVAEPHK